MSTDSEVIRLSLAQPAAFGQLYSRHARVVLRYAISRVGAEGAEDVVSNAFLAAFERRKRYDFAYESALPWLLGFATMAIRQHRRAEGRHLERHRDLELADRHGLLVDETDHRAAELAETLREVKRLAARDRDALLLHAWADLSYAEVARALAVPIGTVRSRINRARTRLREATGRDATTTTTNERNDDGRPAYTPIGDR